MQWNYEIFKTNFYKLTGIDLTNYKERQMKRRVEFLITKKKLTDYQGFYDLLLTDKNVLDEFMSYITINVSEFFRNPAQWEILRDQILPNLSALNRPLKIWSSACSTGEEPYSLAIICNEILKKNSFKILATDLDEIVLDKARKGIYKEKDIKSIPENYYRKYFKNVQNDFIISDEIKQNIEFKHLDLLKDNYPSNCDLIICRNVIIYFTEEAKDSLYYKMSDSLTNNGILFVGCTEQIITPFKYNFVPVKTFFYKKQVC